MRSNLIILLSFIFLNTCQVNWYGDINLGLNFYYLVEPAFNSIVIPVNVAKPYGSSTYIIKNIESLGFNKKYILATSISEKGITYWKIDKTVETKKLGHGEDSIMRLSNVSEISLIEFDQIIRLENIRLKTKTAYRKELYFE